MAVRQTERKLTEAELYAPDLDEDGELDVEHYSIPTGNDAADPYFAEVWDAALKLLDEGAAPEDEPESVEKGVGDSLQSAGRWLADKWAALESRYGRKAALAMAVGMLATFPVPGSIPAIIGIAEGVRGVSGYFQRECGGDVEKLKSCCVIPKNRLRR